MQIDQWTAFVASITGDPEAEDILTSGEPAKIAALAKSKGFSFTVLDSISGGQWRGFMPGIG